VSSEAKAPIGTVEAALARAANILIRDPAQAEAQIREILRAFPEHPYALRLLGAALRRQGETAAAEEAYLRSVKGSVQDAEMIAAANALVDNRLAYAEQMLCARLEARPGDAAAIRMLAETKMRLGLQDEAEALLARCIELAPGFTPVRHNYAALLHRRGKAAETLAQLDALLAGDPEHPAYLSLKAATLAGTGEHETAIRLFAQVLAAHPRRPRTWMGYGHALRAAGRRAEAVDAYRRSLALAPGLGEAWWGLTNLGAGVTPDDVAAMEVQLARLDLSEEDRVHLHFALGRAHEAGGRYEEAFRSYAEGNAQRKYELAYDPEETSAKVCRCKALLTADVLAARPGQGAPAPDAIFIVGMPGAGAALVAQILSGHSQVEAVVQPPDLMGLVRGLGGGPDYPDIAAGLSPDDLRALGEAYLSEARRRAGLGRPFFVDAAPENWTRLGLILPALQHARIIDVRRHPLACAVAAFRQPAGEGAGFTCDLEHLGRAYADYVALMAHLDAVAPGRVHRVIHERLAAEPEVEIRRLLDHCGLAFEAGCLRPCEGETADEGLWRSYDPWLGPLKAALGPVLDAYPAAPAA